MISRIRSQGPQSIHRLKSFPFLVASSAAYAGIVFGCLVAAFAVATTLRASPVLSMGMVITGLLCGIFGGLTLNFALGPQQIKQALNAELFQGASHNHAFTAQLDLIRQSFESQAMNVPAIFLVSRENSGKYGHNVLIAGFSWGRGLFKPALFVSQSILEHCTAQELQAILSHEMAHFRKNHLMKRLSLLCVGFLTATLISSFMVVTIHLATHVEIQGPLILINLMVPVVSTLWLMKRQSFDHEHEADAVSVLKFGTCPLDLKAVLEKLDTINHQKNSRLTLSRIKALDEMASGPVVNHSAA